MRLGLAPLRRLLSGMNHPESEYACIIIGGTNGKGSIAAMSAAMLTAGGFRTGLYTSPHLLDVRERIRVNGRMVTAGQLRACAETVIRNLREEVTYFEFLTAAAFLFFQQQKVDIAVLEVGMGGRLDATNVVRPAVSVISNISMDHVHYLGPTLSHITREKIGIIRKNGCCLTAARQKHIAAMIEEACRRKRARFLRLGHDIRIRKQSDGVFTFRGLGKRYDHLSCPLAGGHQMENAALAIGAVTLLSEHGFSVPEGAVRRGLGEARWEGRLEILQHHPTVLIDGAHNPAGISVLRTALKEHFSYRRLTVIFGVLDDKDFRTMLRRLSPLADSLILTRPDSERSRAPAALLQAAGQFHRCVAVVEKPEEALNRALAAAAPDDLVCVTGSLYLAAPVKRFLSFRDRKQDA